MILDKKKTFLAVSFLPSMYHVTCPNKTHSQLLAIWSKSGQLTGLILFIITSLTQYIGTCYNRIEILVNILIALFSRKKC